MEDIFEIIASYRVNNEKELFIGFISNCYETCYYVSEEINGWINEQSVVDFETESEAKAYFKKLIKNA